MSIPRKHHYVPEFLIQQWADEEGFVSPYVLNQSGKFQQEKRKSPKAFCCQTDLLRTHYKCLAYSQRLESGWFSQIDSNAARVHKKLIRNGNVSLSDVEKYNWTRFIISLLTRQPSLISQAKDKMSIKYQTKFNEDKELTDVLREQNISQAPAEYVKSENPYAFENMTVEYLAKMCNDPKQMQKILSMDWLYIDVSDASFSLVLSDCPLIKTLGGSTTLAFLALPLSPTRIWFAARNPRAIDNIKSHPRRDLVMRINRKSVNQATKWVFDKDGKNGLLVRKLWSQ